MRSINRDTLGSSPQDVVQPVLATATAKSSFGADVLKLILGTITSQTLALLAAPFISRLFPPAAFGGLALFAAVTGTISVITCWRFELAILVPRTDEEASHLFWLSLATVLITTAATTVFVVFAGDVLWHRLNAPELHFINWLIPLNVFLAGLFAIVSAWNTRKRNFIRLSAVEVAGRISLIASQLVLGLSGFATAGVLMGTAILGLLVTTAILVCATWRESSQVLLAGLRWPHITYAFRRYRRFPKYSMAATLLNSSSSHLPPVLLSGFFSLGIAGEYALASRVLRLPGRLIGNSVSQAFFPRAAEATLSGSLGISVETALTYLIRLGLLPCFLLCIIGKDLFIFAFGSRWAEAGIFAQILSLWLFTWFVSSPLCTVFVVLEEQALELVFQATNFATRLLALLVGGLSGNVWLGMVLFTISGVIVYGAYCIAVIKKSGANHRRILKALSSSLAMFAPFGVAVLLVKHLSTSPVPVLIISFTAVVGYFYIFSRRDDAMRGFLQRLTTCVPLVRTYTHRHHDSSHPRY